MRILVVDDEVKLLSALKQIFVENQYAVDTARDGEEGFSLARYGAYDLLIVDVMMPKMTGYAMVKALRKEGLSTPVLMLTAKDAVDDRVEGLDSGADDYLVKPFATKELLARVRALTRRAGDVIGTETLVAGDVQLDMVSRAVNLRDVPLTLTTKEFQLLELFLRNQGQVLPKELILDRIWGFEGSMDTNAVEIYVHFLRKKLDAARKASATPDEITTTIETVRGVGYVFKGSA